MSMGIRSRSAVWIAAGTIFPIIIYFMSMGILIKNFTFRIAASPVVPAIIRGMSVGIAGRSAAFKATRSVSPAIIQGMIVVRTIGASCITTINIGLFTSNPIAKVSILRIMSMERICQFTVVTVFLHIIASSAFISDRRPEGCLSNVLIPIVVCSITLIDGKTDIEFLNAIDDISIDRTGIVSFCPVKHGFSIVSEFDHGYLDTCVTCMIHQTGYEFFRSLSGIVDSQGTLNRDVIFPSSGIQGLLSFLVIEHTSRCVHHQQNSYIFGLSLLGAADLQGDLKLILCTGLRNGLASPDVIVGCAGSISSIATVINLAALFDDLDRLCAGCFLRIRGSTDHADTHGQGKKSCQQFLHLFKHFSLSFLEK